MKILYLTRDLRDGDFVEHELTRLVPQAQIAVLPSADDIINRLHTLARRDVVLVDQGSLGAESHELLKKFRAAGGAPYLLVLAGVADQNSPDQMVQAGADECLVKSAGYLERLTRILQRLAGNQEKAPTPRTEDRTRLILEHMPACVVMIAPDGAILALNWAGLATVGAQRLDQVVGRNLPSLLSPQSREPFSVFLARVCAGQPSSLEFAWSGFDGVPRRQLLKGVPFNREPGTVAATLGVIYDVAAVSGSENQVAAESLEEAQAQCAVLKRELASQQAAEAGVVEKIRALRAEWDGARQSLEKRVREAEEQRASLASLLESTRVGAAEESQERSRWENTLQQLEARVAAAEGQCRALEQALRTADAARLESSGKLEAERFAWQAGVLAIEQKLRQSEQERTDLNAALVHAEQARDQLSSALAAEQERIEAAARRLESSEKARAALESALEEACATRQQQTTSSDTTAEARLKAAREREFELAMLLETLQLEKAQWGTAQADLEERRILAEAERTSLHQALEAAGTVQTRITEELKAERGRLAAERAEREQLDKAHKELGITAGELHRALEQAKTSIAELLERGDRDGKRLEELSSELQRVRAGQTATEAALQAQSAARQAVADELASTRSQLESERHESVQLQAEREHLRRQLLDSGRRYREMIRSRSESFRQTLNAGVARLQHIAESRVALLAAQHREELERLQQLVRDGNLRQQDLDALLADGEGTGKSVAIASEA